MTNSDNAVRVDDNELLLITLMRRDPSAEVQTLEDGELLSATRAGQILSYIQEMQAAAWDEGWASSSAFDAYLEMGGQEPSTTNPYRSKDDK